MFFFGNDEDESSTSSESYSSPLPTKIDTDQPITVASSCSSSSSGSSGATSSTSDEDSSFSSGSSTVSTGRRSQAACISYDEEDKDDETTASSSLFLDLSYEDEEGENESISIRKSNSSSETVTKLSLRLDDVRRLARLGRNATLRNKRRLPVSINKADIHVQVDIDERALCDSTRELGDIVRHAIQDDLATVYSADAESAKLTLCIVIVVMADGSFYRSLTDQDAVMGLAEIGLVWRLFEADDLTVYDGGLVVQTEEVANSLLDIIFLLTRGRGCLLNRLVPRVANGIMSRIADANDELLVEI